MVHWIAEAKALEIHAKLGFECWVDYITDALSDLTGELSPAVKLMLVDVFRAEGMSLRAIGDALKMSKSSVHRQVSQSGTDGLDNQTAESKGSTGSPRKPEARLSTAVKWVKGIDLATVEDLAALAQHLQDARKLLCELIDGFLEDINAASTAEPERLDEAS